MDHSAEQALVEAFSADFQANKIKLPILPDIAMRIRSAMDNPATNAGHVAKIIQADPGIAARVITAANSPLYKGTENIDNLKDAVARIGMQGASNVVNSLTLAQLFQTRSKILDNRMKALWKHSSQVAAISHVLASKTRGLDPNRALFAGLVHDIGVIPILSYAEMHPELSNNAKRLDALLRQFKGQAGAMLLDRWGFDTDMGTVAAEAEHWKRMGGAQVDYCDIVQLAQLHSFVGTPDFSRHPRINEIAAYRKMTVGELGPSQSLQVLDEAKEDIRDMIRLLAA